MPEVEFSNLYPSITYKVPESEGKFARFNNGKFVTKDEQTISALRQNRDFGVSLHEVERYGPSLVNDLIFCQHPGCDKVFKTENALRAHMRVHKGENEGSDN